MKHENQEAGRCRHTDCIYRNKSDPIQTGRCNYASMTGHCRTAGLPERLTLPCNCPRYVPDGSAPKERARDWRDEARALYEAGATDREIAEAIGKKRDVFADFRRKVWKLPPNPDIKGGGIKFDWPRAMELYRRGAIDMEIARELGCSVSSVWRWRYKYELFPNRRRRKKAKA